MTIDLNSTSMFSDRINSLIDDAITAGRNRTERPRSYLGASIIGHECERHVQFEWLRILGHFPPADFKPQTLRRFDRGNVYEDKARYWLKSAGFEFRDGVPGISYNDGKFKGHVDGVIVGGPEFMEYPLLWEAKCLAEKSYKAILKDGLKTFSSTYFAQIQVYMMAFKLKTCLFTVVNADTMELNHILIPKSDVEGYHYLELAGRVFDATDAGIYLSRCTNDPAYFVCKYCDFAEPCWAEK